MKLIRANIFETNSSSTHSLVMCTKETLDKWKNGEILFLKGNDEFVTKGKELNEYVAKSIIYKESKYISTDNGYVFEYKGQIYPNRDAMYNEENIAAITEEQINDWLENCDDSCERPLTYDEYWNSVEEDCYEGFEQTFTTPGKEEVVAFGYYGNDY